VFLLSRGIQSFIILERGEEENEGKDATRKAGAKKVRAKRAAFD